MATGAVAASAADTASTSAPAPPSSSPFMPRWLRNLFPGGEHLPASPAMERQTSGASASSSGGSGPGSEADDIKQLEEMRNMDMQGYVEYCKKMRGGAPPPRPRRPSVSPDHYDYRTMQDQRRIAFLRMQQHEHIGSLVTKEESDLILAKREDVVKNRALLQAIADRTGVYIDLEVKDCIEQFLETRENAGQMHRYATEFGMPLPKGSQEQREMRRFMKRVEAEEKLAVALEKRDLTSCSLRHKLSWAGPTALCDQTGLRYHECCGALKAGAAAGEVDVSRLRIPPMLLHSKKAGKREVVDKDRERQVHGMFKSRAEGILRKAAMDGVKPRLRDY
ncbi:hypothetical protein CHLRE_12g521050v5 [Chlamydomonas reinhardtii]|uniref:Uncharacterized protein n=1 Tax=Chlamydomonas reinhardtii TaxID=3055 RepID=A0A2K3D424_CHLRE|nr:uncharacterized protein CHLRE_12g521050v5 [Chlamydomonas reinhardtii]PNW75294.1 hypothetical protein CHLRE_12g521050v5 [Chlamydomonas reinhardtii]